VCVCVCVCLIVCDLDTSTLRRPRHGLKCCAAERRSALLVCCTNRVAWQSICRASLYPSSLFVQFPANPSQSKTRNQYNSRYQQMHFYIYETLFHNTAIPDMFRSLSRRHHQGLYLDLHIKSIYFRCRFEQYVTYTLSGEWVHRCLTVR
jgi:hypothetical protein